METLIGTDATMLEDSASDSAGLIALVHTLGERDNVSQAGSSANKAAQSPEARAVPSFDPDLPPFVAASIEEIRYAQHLRRQIVQRYLAQPAPPVSPWCVGAD